MASYEGALEAAGAVVHAFQEFGSYQGDWWARVTYEGVTGWVRGCYGSCSGCDSLQSEFDYDNEPAETFEIWAERLCWRDEPQERITPEIYAEAVSAFRDRYAAFGRGYLDDILTQEQAEAQARESADWDSEGDRILAFIAPYAIAGTSWDHCVIDELESPSSPPSSSPVSELSPGLSRFADLGDNDEDI